MTDDEHVFQHIFLDQPIDGLDEEYERVRAKYVLNIAEMILGVAGTMISASKTGFVRRSPDHVAVFNANVCIEPTRKIWFGDIDLTEDECKLAVLAKALDTKVYVLYERDGRFGGKDENPLLEKAVLTVAPDGGVEYKPGIRRGEDGRLRLAP